MKKIFSIHFFLQLSFIYFNLKKFYKFFFNIILLKLFIQIKLF